MQGPESPRALRTRLLATLLALVGVLSLALRAQAETALRATTTEEIAARYRDDATERKAATHPDPSLAGARPRSSVGCRSSGASSEATWISPRVAAEGELATEADATTSDILRNAARGKGNFGLGRGTAAEADVAGRAWVGEDATVASDGSTLGSKDGLRQYRPPSYKPNLGRYQANFESRPQGTREWQSNGHFDVEDRP